MGTYKTSDGERVSKATIDKKVREAKEKVIASQLEEHGYNYCVVCGKSGARLDCSHVIGVYDCEKRGMVELAWSPENIEILCRECHQKRDGNDVRLEWVSDVT